MRASRKMSLYSTGTIDVANLEITFNGSALPSAQDSIVLMDDSEYRLLTITESGVLSIHRSVKAQLCLVGGGNAGGNGDNTTFGGGAGAYLINYDLSTIGGVITIGGGGTSESSGGNTTYTDTTLGNSFESGVTSGKNGGTGGGGHALSNRVYGPGIGDGNSKYPFGSSSFSVWSDKPHCAGGGSGAVHYGSYTTYIYAGGHGGSNGGNGTAATLIDASASAGDGGSYGGGAGGAVSSPTSILSAHNGYDATYYGSGAGQGGYIQTTRTGQTTKRVGNGGSGYQGIAYIRIPINQSA